MAAGAAGAQSPQYDDKENKMRTISLRQLRRK